MENFFLKFLLPILPSFPNPTSLARQLFSDHLLFTIYLFTIYLFTIYLFTIYLFTIYLFTITHLHLFFRRDANKSINYLFFRLVTVLVWRRKRLWKNWSKLWKISREFIKWLFFIKLITLISQSMSREPHSLFFSNQDILLL